MGEPSGFTLIEIMVTLVIVGILATVAGTALVAGINGYLSARENDAMAQKSQLAMARLSRELTEFTTIPSPGSNAKASSIIVERLSGTGASAVTRTVAIGLDGQSVKIKEDGEGTTPDFRDGDVLIDNVNSLAFSYYRGASAWAPGSDDLRLLSGIRIQLVLNRPDAGTTVAFSTTVHPRNNGNIGGAALPASPPDQSRYTGCFVATAAYGNYNHPMVLVLREFRDSLLVNSDAGRRLIGIYYTIGPSLAGLIQERPWARLLVRLVLLPVVFLAFLLTRFPLAVPVLIVASWIAARAITRSKGGSPMNPKHTLSSQKGAVLIAVVVTMVIFATLGAVMLNLFTASTHSQFVGNRSVRAYYLAEAGYRYAASQYLNATTETAREAALAGLHNRTFTLANNDGQFRFQVYPYWYKVVSTGGNQLIASVVGQYPLSADSYENGSWVQIRDANTGNVTYAQLASANPGAGGDSGRVDFTKYQNQPWGSITANSIISPVALTKSSGGAGNQTVGHNGELFLEAGSGYRAFPRWNGVVSVKDTSNNERTLAYRELYIDDGTGTYKLRGITDPNAATMTNITIAPGTKVILGKFVRLSSKGIIGAGQAMEATRKVDFYIPVGYLSGSAAAPTEYKDNIDMNKWQADGTSFSQVGTQTVVTGVDGGDSAMNMSGAVGYLYTNCNSVVESSVGFNWGPSGANVPFDQYWLDAGRYLAYDVQVKLATLEADKTTQLNVENPPYAHGISFALDGNGNSWGVSLWRSRYVSGDSSSYGCDGVPSVTSAFDILPYGGQPLFALWVKSYPATMTAVPTDVVASPCNTTDDSGFNFPTCAANIKALGTVENWLGIRDPVRMITTGTLPTTTPTQIQSNELYYVRALRKNGISYKYFYASRSASWCDGITKVCTWDAGDPNWLQIQDGGAGTHTIIKQEPSWVWYAGAMATARGPQSPSSTNDQYHVVNTSTFAIRKWVNMMLRTKEAPSIQFINGGGYGVQTRIKSGDEVYQTSDCTPSGPLVAVARVAWDPVYLSYSTKTWDGTAQGALVLDVLKDASGNVRPYTFDNAVCSGKFFVGKWPNGVQLANLRTVDNNEYRSKDIWVRLFVADPNDQSVSPSLSSADTDPWDPKAANTINRKALPRDTVVWPAEDILSNGVSQITADTDYWTLVKWQYMTPNSTICSGFISDTNTVSGLGESDQYYDTLRLGNYNKTPNSGSFPSVTAFPVVGLHAYGVNSTNVYFDDFAVRLPGYRSSATQGFTQSFQQ